MFALITLGLLALIAGISLLGSALLDTCLDFIDKRREEYIDIVIEQLEHLAPEIVIHRITGDPKVSDLIEPDWLIKKFCVLNEIDKEMKRRDSYQGKNLKI